MLAGLPVLAMLAIAVLNPPYTAFLLQTEEGRRMLAFAFGMQLAGCALMSRVMRLEF